MTVVELSAQAREPISEMVARRLARDAERASKGDPTELILALDESVRARYGDFEAFPLSIVRGQDMLVTVTAPYMAYRRSLVDLLRTRRPIADARWLAAVLVVVEPMRLDAPDIDDVTVTRNGTAVPNVGNMLKAMTFSNGAGEQRAVHAGSVAFPVAAFEPGADVTLRLSGRAMEAITHSFSDTELATLR